MACSGMVYDDAEKLYAEVRKDVESLLEEAFGTLLQKSIPVSQEIPLQVAGTSGCLVGFNMTSFPRRDIIKIPLHATGSHMKSKVVQTSLNGSLGYVLMDFSEDGSLAAPSGLYADCMPPFGMFVLWFSPSRSCLTISLR